MACRLPAESDKSSRDSPPPFLRLRIVLNPRRPALCAADSDAHADRARQLLNLGNRLGLAALRARFQLGLAPGDDLLDFAIGQGLYVFQSHGFPPVPIQ